MIVAARSTNQTSDKQQAAAMMEETIDNVAVQSPGKYPPMLAITRRRPTSSMLWAWTRSSRRSRPATAGLCHPRPEVAYPAICLPGTGSDGSYRPSGVGSATLCGCKLWSRYSARSSRAWGFRQFLLRGLEPNVNRMVADLHRPQPAKLFRFGVNLHRKARADGPAQRIRNFARGSEARRYSQSYLATAGWGNRQN